MHAADPVVTITIFFGMFFASISLLQYFSDKTGFPYTVSLLIAGLATQFVTKFFHLEAGIHLSTDVIFYILLPLLLFDSAMRVNYHQFRLHFRTITFISTFGLLVSIAIVASVMALALGFPWIYGLLFGALISATDPIAVVALFKSLRAPKRLALIIEGESMFNDATAVIAFRIVSSIALASTALDPNSVFFSFSNFLYVFFGSIVFGGLLGYIASKIVKQIDNDHIVETTITVAVALTSFIIGEHYLGVSGVISTVMAAIIFGNQGRTAISRGVAHFIDHLWEYISFVAISLVFFFATYTLDIGVFLGDWKAISIVVLATLIARAISVYISFFITNNVWLFKKEPNVPLKWQHIMNWGGLRGVIPLVLVYTLPDEFEFKQELISFTFASFLFSLFVNGVTIKMLLVKLGVHLPEKEEEIIKEEKAIFEIEQYKEKFANIPEWDRDKEAMEKIKKSLEKEELVHKNRLLKMTSTKAFLRSLKYQALEIERDSLNEIFAKGYISESVYFTFETQLDLQLDALEYPGLATLPTYKSFKERRERIRKLSNNYPILARIADVPEKTLVKNRIALLKVRIDTTYKVLKHLDRLKKHFQDAKSELKAIKTVEKEYKYYLDYNLKQYQKLRAEDPEASQKFTEEYLYKIIRQ